MNKIIMIILLTCPLYVSSHDRISPPFRLLSDCFDDSDNARSAVHFLTSEEGSEQYEGEAIVFCNKCVALAFCLKEYGSEHAFLYGNLDSFKLKYYKTFDIYRENCRSKEGFIYNKPENNVDEDICKSMIEIWEQE